jgi:hypothetical protein
MHPEIAKTLVDQRRHEIIQHTAGSRRDLAGSGGSGWLSRHLPRWHVSWSRTVLSSGSSLVIIISAHRSA